ncbi:hypothetical protein QBC45DRAFT_404910 [Copromyces sp. CBS 386.78]|nr:hypothetical protein QBC45DRAFT_404910 [Copromyces sp. CBS 386.78]
MCVEAINFLFLSHRPSGFVLPHLGLRPPQVKSHHPFISFHRGGFYRAGRVPMSLSSLVISNYSPLFSTLILAAVILFTPLPYLQPSSVTGCNFNIISIPTRVLPFTCCRLWLLNTYLTYCTRPSRR